MSSRRAPSNVGRNSLTLKRRANRPSVLSMMRAARPSQRARTTSPFMAATTIRSASTAPLAVYRCTAKARRRNQSEAGVPLLSWLTSSIRFPPPPYHLGRHNDNSAGGSLPPPKAPNLQEGRSPPLPGAGRLLYLDRSDHVARLPIPLRVALADGVYDVHPPDDSSED